MPGGPQDLYAVVCNYQRATRRVRKGSLAYFMFHTKNSQESITVTVRNRMGKWIEQQESPLVFDNFRCKVINHKHIFYNRPAITWMFQKNAEKVVEMLETAREKVSG